jgi:hypothetical protein
LTSGQHGRSTYEDNYLLETNVTQSLKELSMAFYWTNYVLPNPTSTNGYLDYLSILYSKRPTSAALSEVITSLGMAGISNLRKSSEIMVEARRSYATALRLTNTALADPTQVKTDETLMAVLLLAFYEVCPNIDSIKYLSSYSY